MGQVLVRNLDDSVIAALRSQASAKGLSLETELRDVLTSASRAKPIEELRAIRAMTPDAPKGSYMLAEDIVAMPATRRSLGDRGSTAHSARCRDGVGGERDSAH